VIFEDGTDIYLGRGFRGRLLEFLNGAALGGLPAGVDAKPIGSGMRTGVGLGSINYAVMSKQLKSFRHPHESRTGNLKFAPRQGPRGRRRGFGERSAASSASTNVILDPQRGCADPRHPPCKRLRDAIPRPATRRLSAARTVEAFRIRVMSFAARAYIKKHQRSSAMFVLKNQQRARPVPAQGRRPRGREFGPR